MKAPHQKKYIYVSLLMASCTTTMLTHSNLFALPILPLTFMSLFACITLQPTPIAYQADPARTIILMDVHDVIVQAQYSRIVHKTLTMPQAYTLIPLLANPYFLYDVIHSLLYARVAEQTLLTLVQKYPRLKPFYDILLNISNEQKPIESTVSIIKKLKNLGYPLYVFSNIGHTAYQRLSQRYASIFNNFEGAFVATPDNNWLQKPFCQAYDYVIEALHTGPHDILFIDDNAENLKTAQLLGINTILYTSESQLIEDLQTIGIFI